MKTYGTITLKGDDWVVEAEPHVMVRLKRIFTGKAKTATAKLKIRCTPESCRDLEWFCERYPLTCSHPDALAGRASEHRDAIQTIEDIIGGRVPPPEFALAVPPRDYQARAAAAFALRRSLLLTDALGLGKTCTAIASIAATKGLPALVVAPTHLQRQWEREIRRFAPDLLPHILKKSTPYELPEFFGRRPDVLIATYQKLAGWSSVLREYCRFVVFDEAHELRVEGSQKYKAAKEIAERCEFRLGMTATPVFNYGDEIFSIVEILRPGALGTITEFRASWCKETCGVGSHSPVRDPAAFGSYLRDEFIMLRRTRAEVGRELPPLTKIVHEVDTESKPLDDVQGIAAELARAILGADRRESFAARTELDWKLRQATGIAKAPAVAAFVAMLVEGGEAVVLGGWHHAVYDLWESALKAAGIKVARYTGEESIAEKDRAAQAFRKGEIDVLMISIRSGAGLDGLQERASVVVHGELDWSPAVHDQLDGRLNRDGQKSPVMAYYLVSDDGSDPIIARTLGLKREQADGIAGMRPGDAALSGGADHVRALAEEYLRAKKIEIPTSPEAMSA